LGKNPHLGTLDKLTSLVAEMESQIQALESALGHKHGGDVLAEARHFHEHVIPAMNGVREISDQLEVIVADEIWPLPTYREMLFVK
jgi:glutamine synthetase